MLHFGSFKGLLRLTSLLILKEVGSKYRLIATSHIEGLFCTLGRGGGGSNKVTFCYAAFYQ